ncbi:MAG TPA: hypothetical protein VI911_10605 [Patescibacteria group bacterium]|nr:hypothetical protein [Patescibacteria group bacterium]
MNTKKLNQGERHLFEYKYQMSGGFFTKLFDCIFHADVGNEAKLSLAFPEEVEAVKRYQNESGYWDKLEKTYKESEDQ